MPTQPEKNYWIDKRFISTELITTPNQLQTKCVCYAIAIHYYVLHCQAVWYRASDTHPYGPVSDNELDKAVVLTDISLQDVLAGTENTLKTSSVQLDTFECAFSFDCCSTWSLQQESNLTCTN